MNITNNTLTGNNIENARSSHALNHVKLTTQIFCISFLAVIVTLFYANYSLASSLSSKVNSIKGIQSKPDKEAAFQRSSKSISQSKIFKTYILNSPLYLHMHSLSSFTPSSYGEASLKQTAGSSNVNKNKEAGDDRK